MAKVVPNKKEHPAYLIITPVEELIDDGIQFEGETEKDRVMNITDFSRTRGILQKYNQTITRDEEETLVRYIKLCIKPESLA